MAMSEYQSSVEFRQVCEDQYDEGLRAFLYNVWHEHPEWDLSFLREATREMVAKFNAPPETPLEDPPADLVLPVELAPPVDQPLQVINEDFPIVNTGGGGGADKDKDLVQIDNPTEVLSSEDRPPTFWQP